MRKGNNVPNPHQLGTSGPILGDYLSSSSSSRRVPYQQIHNDPQPHNIPNRSNQPKYPLPKKYTLVRPERKDLNPRLGPPDFFPLDSNAPEDILTQKSIIEGLVEPKIVNDEFSSLRKYFGGSGGVNISEVKNQLLQSAHEIEWKRSIIPKEKDRVKRAAPFPELVVTTKEFRESWMARLAGAEGLQQLAAQVPHGFKGEPLIKVLMDTNTPILRATWFVKIIYLNMKHNRQKNPTDPTSDWTTTLAKFLLQQMKEFHNPKTGSNQDCNSKIVYILKLTRWSYCEGLIDKDKFLTYIMEQLQERGEDSYPVFRILLQYIDDISSSVIHSRRLVSQANSRLARLGSSRSGSGSVSTSTSSSASLSQSQNPAKLEPLLRIISHALANDATNPSSNTSENSQENTQFLDAPKVIEYLEQAVSYADLDVVYSNVFSDSTSPAQLQYVEPRIYLVCEWAITKYRKNDVSACVAVNILKRCAEKLEDSPTKPPLQGVLTEFLERCEHGLNTWLLYGELLRYGLFSHDGYVRYLISRGRLESDSIFHRNILEQLPIFEYDISGQKRGSALHEKNQLRTVLRSLSSSNANAMIEDEVIEETVTCLFGTGFLPTPLHSLPKLTLHDQWTVAEWLTASVMQSLAPDLPPPPISHNVNSSSLSTLLTIPSCTGEVIYRALYILRIITNFRALAVLICWIIKHCTTDDVILTVISCARDLVHVFVAQDMLGELVLVLGEQIQHSSLSGRKSCNAASLHFFRELLDSYRNISALKKCETVILEISRDFVPAPLPATSLGISLLKVDSQLERLWIGSRHLTDFETQDIDDVAHGIHDMDNTLRVQAVIRSILAACTRIPAKDRRSQLVVFSSLLAITYADLGPKPLAEGIHNALATLIVGADMDVIAGFLVTIASRQVLPVTQIISNILVPLLQETLPHLTETQGLSHANFLVFFVRALLGHNNHTEVLDSEEKSIFLQNGKLISLAAVLPPVIQIYATLLPLSDAMPRIRDLRSGVEAVLADEDSIHVCMTNAAYVHKHLQKLGASHRRQVLSLLSFGGTRMSPPVHSQENYVPLTRANVNELAPKMVTNILNEIISRVWVVQHGWLQAQLLLDEWQSLDPENALPKFVVLILGHFASHWWVYTVYNKLIDFMGPPVQFHVVRAALRILEKQYSDDSLAASHFDLSVHIKTEIDTTSADNDEELCNAFSNLILGALKDNSNSNNTTSLNQLKTEFVLSIENQLRKITSSAPSLDSLDLPIRILHAAQRSVHIRLKLLGRLYPLTRAPDLATTLIRLLSRSFISAENDGDLGADLITNILACIASLMEENDDISRRIGARVKEVYSTILTCLPSHLRFNIETTLNIIITTNLNSSTYNAPTQPQTEPWSLLENYQECPLSPSQLGGARINRKVLKYANQVFDRAEPPLKRIKI